MKFRTEYLPHHASFSLSPRQPVVMLGSCFSDNIAAKMRQGMWDAVNPGGTLYNPVSIAKVVKLFLNPHSFEKEAENTIFQHSDSYFHSFLFDSKVSATSREVVLESIKKRRDLFLNRMENAQALFITFGTSIVYSLADSERPEIVSNCHKLSSKLFKRFRLDTDEIAALWVDLAKEIKARFPNLINIVFTVSPVRHLKDGFEGNARSKAVLVLAVEKICDASPLCSYFPAYEILNDDLRDYRFYASDLAHPSEEAVEYIWDKFKETFLDATGKELLKKGESLVKAYNHRPLISTEDQRAAYKLQIENKISDFLKQNPGMAFQS